MKIFISWSGPRSRAVAEALNDWLRRVVQSVKPFYSPDIEKGAKWSNELDEALDGTRFGIICLTPDNLPSKWIHYEAGALSKTPDALIWTFLHGINPGDVPQPLGKFQHTVAEREDVFNLLKSINKRLQDVGGVPLDNDVLSESFERYWPDLEGKLNAAEGIGDSVEKPREDREILLEILEIVRIQQRTTNRNLGNSVQQQTTNRNLGNSVQQRSSLSLPYLWSRYSITLPPDMLISTDKVQQIRDEIKANYPDADVQLKLMDEMTDIVLCFSKPLAEAAVAPLLDIVERVAGINDLIPKRERRVIRSPLPN